MRARVAASVVAAVQTALALVVGVPLFFLYRLARRLRDARGSKRPSHNER